jgi:hypothetical protein
MLSRGASRLVRSLRVKVKPGARLHTYWTATGVASLLKLMGDLMLVHHVNFRGLRVLKVRKVVP